MSQPTMAAGFAAAFLDYVSVRGAARGALLDACGLAEADIADQDARIPVDAYHRLIGAAMHMTGDTSLLLRHTLETQLETMSIVGQIVHSSASMLHSMQQLNRYARLMANVGTLNGADRFEVLQDRGQVWIVDHLPVPDENYLGIEAAFARFVSEFRRSFPDRVFAIEMEVSYPPPPHADTYEALLDIPVRFGASRNALRIDPGWLETDFAPGKDYLFAIFTRHADDLLAQITRSDTARAMAEAQILPELHEGTLSMDKVARNLGMSRQTLYRRLKQEGVTFAEIHDDLRRRMALDYLSARKVSVNEAAYLLGFSEASSFVRAFKRWTGQSPTAYLTAH